MDPENIMLSERGHSQEGEDCMIPFKWNVQNMQVVDQENSLVVGSGLEKSERRMITNQYQFFGGKGY